MWSIRLRMAVQLLVLLFAIFAAVRTMLTPETGTIGRTVAGLVIGSALGLMLSRDTYLPFLGFSALPPAALVSERVPEKADIEIALALPDVAEGSRVIYWGAGPETAPGAVVADPWTAYADYANTGVAVVRDGLAKLRFQCPSQYKVGGRFLKRTLERHLHYRVCCAKTGLLGPVETKYVTCDGAALRPSAQGI